MFNRYPDQAASRKGYALGGIVFLLFGIAMGVFGAIFIAASAIGLALVLLLPSLFCSHSAFSKFERVLGQLFAGW